MTETNVKWLHAPGHAGSVQKAVIEYAIGLDPLVIDWSEMYWNVDELEKYGKGYNHFIGDPKRKDKRGRVVNHDVVISTSKTAKVLHDEEFFISKEIAPNLKYMPERWGKARVIQSDGLVVLIVIAHPQPNPFRRIALVLPSYRRGVRRTQRTQRELELQFKPDLVFYGGDLQLGFGARWVYPNKYAERNDMRYRRHKIDWQLWKGRGFKFVSFVTKNPKPFHKKMDHLWTLLTLQK